MPLSCASCGEVIGAYEPVVVLKEGDPPRRTSLAAEPDLPHLPGSHYHCDCHARAHGGDEQAEI